MKKQTAKSNKIPGGLTTGQFDSELIFASRNKKFEEKLKYT